MIRTLVAESSVLICSGLLTLLAGQPDIEVVADLEEAGLLVSAADESRADVAIIAEEIAGNGFTAIRALRERVPGCRSVVMVSRHSPGRLREAVKAGADGFLERVPTPGAIIEAIRLIASGGKAIDPDLAFSALNAEASPLTPREIDVLRLAAEGAPAAEIATTLYLSVGTVRNYISRAVEKTAARTKMDAVRIAEDAGWL